MPTLAREPGQWALPVWLAGPALAMGVLVVGLAGCVLSWWWASDSYAAAFMTHRLLALDSSNRRRPLPDSVVPPDGRWVSTTAQHLAHWAVFLRGTEGDETRAAPEIASLLVRAQEASPLNPTARLALAQLNPAAKGATRSIRGLGLSRDAVSLAWGGRTLANAGKKAAALRLFGHALSAASRRGFSRTATPRFDDDPTVRRYLLPGEERVRDIVDELASRNDWTFREWSPALPRNPMVLLATARLLRELGRSDEAEGLLDLILEEDAPGTFQDPADPLIPAARAEALASRSRWKDAGQEYRRAIELIDNDTIRRSWWFNLADIAFRLNDESQRQLALRAALAVAHSDDITRRATMQQRGVAAPRRPRLGGAKAN
jgi:tetratricopeptide (TPR) repeat protein